MDRNWVVEFERIVLVVAEEAVAKIDEDEFSVVPVLLGVSGA
jgi:hypothetical protein